MFKREEAKFLVEDVGAKAIICSIDKIEDSINISSHVDRVKHIISHPSPQERTNVLNFYEKREFPVEEDDIVEIIYTSGTTGRPIQKIVI